MRNAGLEEAQAGIKIGVSGRNINHLRHADDTTLMAESEELKSLLMKVKEKSEKVGLKLNIQKTKMIASGPITSWQIDGETVAAHSPGSRPGLFPLTQLFRILLELFSRSCPNRPYLMPHGSKVGYFAPP